MNDVTIIIPTLAVTADQLFAYQHCVDSLVDSVPGAPRVVASNTGLCLIPGNIKLEEQGQCKAVNAAAATVNTRWLFVTNDDMIYAPGWLDKLLGTALKYKLKVVCPNLVEPRAGAPPFLVRPFGGAGGDFQYEAWLDFASKHQDYTLEEGFNLPFLIDRDVWQRIGGYDINYDPWGSNGDSDLQAKLILSGLETFRDRNVVVYHFSQTSGTFHPDNHYYWEKNYAYFTDKWGFERQPDSDKVWYSRDIIDYKKLTYKPEWMGKLGKDMLQPMVNFKGFHI